MINPYLKVGLYIFGGIIFFTILFSLLSSPPQDFATKSDLMNLSDNLTTEITTIKTDISAIWILYDDMTVRLKALEIQNQTTGSQSPEEKCPYNCGEDRICVPILKDNVITKWECIKINTMGAI